MPFFSAIAAGIGAAFTFATTTVFGKLLAGVALNALASALFAPELDASTPKIEREVRQGIVPRSFIVGRTATAGSLVYHNTFKIDSDDDEHEIYAAVYALSDLPVRRLTKMWIDGEEVTLNGPTTGRAGDFGYNRIPEFDRRGFGKGNYKFYDGTQTEADDLLVQKASTPDRPWNENAVGTGVAYIVMVYDYDVNLFTGIPVPLFEIDGVPLDMPNGSSIGQNSRFHDLPANQIYNLLKGVSYDGKWLYGPQVPAVLEAGHWNDAVQSCATEVPGADGWSDARKQSAFGSLNVPARYRSGLEVSVARPVSETISDLASACNGRFSEVAGAFRFQVGNPPSAPDFSFTDDDILLTSEQDFSPFLPLAETVNAVTAIYPEPEQQYQDQEPSPLYVPGYEEDDGNRRLTTTARLDAVPYKEQVQRLMKSSLAEARRARRHTHVFPPEFWSIEPGDYGSWSSDRNGYQNKMFRVDGVRDLPTGDVAVDLTEVDPNDYDFDADDFTPVDGASLVQPGVPTFEVPNWSVSATSIPDGSGSGRRAAIRMAWDADRNGRGIIYRVYLAGTNTVVSSGSTDDYQSGFVIVSEGILSLTNYEVQGRRVVRRGNAPWSARLPVSTGDFRLTFDDMAQEIRQTLDAAQANAEEAADDSAEALAKSNEIVDNLSGTIADMISNYAALDAVVQTVNLTADDLATIQSAYISDSDLESAVAASLEQYDASFDGGLSSTITDIKAAQADADGFLQAYAGLTVETTGGGVAGFRATSYADPDGSGGSVLQLLGDQVIAPGTLTAGTVVVTDGTGNLIPNPNLRLGDFSGWSNVDSSINVQKRDAGGSAVRIANAPSKFFLDFPYSSSNQTATMLKGQPVEPGQRFSVEFKWIAFDGASIRMTLFFLDEDGVEINSAGLGQFDTQSSGWRKESGVATAPAGAVTMDARILRVGGVGGGIASAAAFSVIAQRTGTTLIEPGGIFTPQLASGAVTAEKIDVIDLSAVSANLGTIKVGRGNIANLLQSDDWSYSSDYDFSGIRLNFATGAALFSGPVITRRLQVATGTFAVQKREGQGGNQTEIQDLGYAININTGFVVRPWEALNETYVATVGMDAPSNVSSINSATAYWGFRAQILPITNFTGPATLWLKIYQHDHDLLNFDGQVRWRVYEVT